MRPNFSRAFVAGFAGTLVITLMMYFVSPWMTGGPMDIASLLGILFGGSWAAGIVAHAVIGTLILPALYCFLFFRLLTGSPAVRGMSWGLILWFVSQAAVMPLLGAGLFSDRIGGLSVALDSLIGHLAYGLVFGLIAGGTHEPSREHSANFGSHAPMRRAG